MGRCRFFFDHWRTLLSSYPRLFDRIDDDAGPATNILAQYGWLMVVWRMSNHDVLKFDQIFRMKAREFLNYTQMLQDIMAEEQMRARRK